ncbi:MAG: NAD-dependent succinate-semialdehyde dehydrogenase [Planctomycetes bacterium]|nr:NAD-dependent succinate-semialdehyde dehydrogenase [Planctomycetota bacterium]
MPCSYQLLIDGEWREALGGRSWDVINPSTQEIVRTMPFGDARDCRAAIEAAARAFPAWSQSTPYHRAAILKNAATRIREQTNALAQVTVRESGKPLREARGEWLGTAELYEWYAEECKRVYGHTIPSRKPDRRFVVMHQPIGVVGTITAWNFPAYNPSRSWAAALAAGCTVVGRPSEQTPLSAMELGAILLEAGLPKGVLNVIHGDPPSMATEMLDHPALRKISFTGSSRVGRLLMDGASRTHTKLALELGGNAPVIILPDADVKALAPRAVATKFLNAGQVCVAPQRFLVHEQIRNEFVELASSSAALIRVGDGLDESTQLGPMIREDQRSRLEDLVDDARAGGARVRVGGKRPAHLSRGWFFEPTLIDGLTPEHRLFREEAFGPVLPVGSFNHLQEAITLANQTPHGLAAYVFTSDIRAAWRAAEQLEFGMVGINEWFPHGVEAPFHGWKQSGQGSESGAEGLHEYLETKVVAFGGIT